MEFIHHLVVSITQPVNCLTNLGVEVVHSGAAFVMCVVANLQNIV